MTLAEMLDKLEAGRMGHEAAMKWLGVDSLNDLVTTVQANGRQMPGHRPGPLAPATRDVLRLATRKPPATQGPR